MGDPLVGLNAHIDWEAFRPDLSSTLSDYMITIFQDRHSGMDCRNSGSMDGFELAIHGTGYPLPCGYDELAH